MENEIKENELEKVEEVEEAQTVEAETEVEALPEPITYSSKYLQDIEDARKAFLKVYQTQNRFKWVVSAISIVLIIFAFIFFPNMVPGPGGMAGMIAMGVGAVLLTLLYSIYTRKGMDKKLQAYFLNYYNSVNNFVFDDKDIENMSAQFPGKIQIEAFTDNMLFKNVDNVGSRGLTEFEYKNTPIAVCDAAAQTKVDRRAMPVFVGKYLYAAAEYDFDDPLYIYFKGDKRALPPTNLEGVKVVLENDKYLVYSNNKDWKKVVNNDVKKIFDKIKMNKYFVDLSISVQKGRMFVCMGYDDPLMVLPLQNEFDPKPNEQFKLDVYNVLDLIKEFNK